MHSTTMHAQPGADPPAGLQTMAEDRDSGQLVSAVDCYFMCQDGGMFKAKVVYAPYFYVQVKVRGRGAWRAGLGQAAGVVLVLHDAAAWVVVAGAAAAPWQLCRSGHCNCVCRSTIMLSLYHCYCLLPTARCPRCRLQDDAELEVEGYLRRKYEGKIKDIEVVARDDLDQVCEGGGVCGGWCCLHSLHQRCHNPEVALVPVLCCACMTLLHNTYPLQWLHWSLGCCRLPPHPAASSPPRSATTCRACSASSSNSASGACSS